MNAWQVGHRGDAEVRSVALAGRYGVTMRSVVGVAASVVVLLGEPFTAARATECVVLIGWSAFRFWGRSHPQRWLVVADLALILAVALAQPLTENAAAVIAQTTLSAAVCGTANTTLVWQFERRGAALACAVITATYVLGAGMVTGVGPPWSVSFLYFLPAQAVVSRVLYESVLRGARGADGESAKRTATAVSVQVAAARRAAEREHWAMVHDTAAATLLMVGNGVPAETHDLVRVQARRDLAALNSNQLQPGATGVDAVELIAAVRRIAAESPLTVGFTGPPAHLVPANGARAVTGAVGELLTNVTRHAQVSQVSIDVRATPDRLEVVLSDQGVGFPAGQVHGRGLRHSVIGRMERVGGRATIRAVPDGGTTAILQWGTP